MMQDEINSEPTEWASGLRRLHTLYCETLRKNPARLSNIDKEMTQISERLALSRSELLYSLYDVYRKLIALRVPLHELPPRTADLHFRPAGKDGFDPADPERELARDPSRPDLWLLAADGHWRMGNLERAHQLLRRLSASGYEERSMAHTTLTRLVKASYNSVPVSLPP